MSGAPDTVADAAPDTAMVEELFQAIAWLDAVAGNPDPDGQQAAMIAAAAQNLADATDAERDLLCARKIGHDGLLHVLAALDDATLSELAIDLAGRDGYGLALFARALQMALPAAAAPEAMLPPGGVATLLLLALQTGGTSAAYLARITAATLMANAVPARLSRPLAILAEIAATRFGEAAALGLAAAHLQTRLLAPAGVVVDDTALATYTNAVIDAGQAAEAIAADGEDPDDLLTQRGAALVDIDGFLRCFAQPAPDDPLGTLPAQRLTALGQALLAARATRPVPFDWGAVLDARAEEPEGFLELQTEERAILLDLVLTQTGITPLTELPPQT